MTLDEHPGIQPVALERPLIDLSRSGTPDREWVAALDGAPTITADALADGNETRRLVVIAPHPDDETFGVGGLIVEWSAAGRPTTIVCLTDGEAAPPPAGTSPDPDRLAARRRTELATAASRLTTQGPVEVVRGGLPDGALVDHIGGIERLISVHAGPDDLVAAPLDCDGHPDHEAAGVAARRSATGRRTLWYPVWAWHWHEPRYSPMVDSSVRVSVGPEAQRRRRLAAASYVSQTSGSSPVVPAEMLLRFDRLYDVLVGPHDCGKFQSTVISEPR